MPLSAIQNTILRAPLADTGSPLPILGEAQLLSLLATPEKIAERRRRNKMEPFTRVTQWHIVDELLRRKHPKADELLRAETVEAEIRARHLGLPYRPGDRLTPFRPDGYPDDQAIIRRIKQLSGRADYLSREALIDIADYVQTAIVEPGHTADHLSLVTAILSTRTSEFNYPTITRQLEKATAALAKTNSRTHLDLAPTYYILWTKTLKQTYLNRFQTTLRHCHCALSTDTTYPHLGIDKTDPATVTRAKNLLSSHPQTLWILGLTAS